MELGSPSTSLYSTAKKYGIFIMLNSEHLFTKPFFPRINITLRSSSGSDDVLEEGVFFRKDSSRATLFGEGINSFMKMVLQACRLTFQGAAF